MWPESPEMQTMAGIGVILVVMALYLVGCYLLGLRRRLKKKRQQEKEQRTLDDDYDSMPADYDPYDEIWQPNDYPDPAAKNEIGRARTVLPAGHMIPHNAIAAYKEHYAEYINPDVLDKAILEHNKQMISELGTPLMSRREAAALLDGEFFETAEGEQIAAADVQPLPAHMRRPPSGVSAAQTAATDITRQQEARETQTDLSRLEAQVREEVNAMSPEEREELARPTYRERPRRQGRTAEAAARGIIPTTRIWPSTPEEFQQRDENRRRSAARVNAIAVAEHMLPEGHADEAAVARIRAAHPGFDVAHLNEAVRRHNGRVEAVRRAQELGQPFAIPDGIYGIDDKEESKTQQMPKKDEPRRKLDRKER